MIKKILLFIGLLSICSPLWASGQDQFYDIADFSKGQNTHASPYILPENQAILDQNIRVNAQYGGIVKRDTLSSLVNYATSAPITSVYRYYNNANSTQQTIITSSTNILSDINGAPFTIKDGMTSGKRWQWVTYKNMAIGGNGYDAIQKWDGLTLTTADTNAARSANELCAQLGAPFVQLHTGSGLTASKWYVYRIAYYDGSLYYYSTALSNPILTGPTTCVQATLTGIPQGINGTTHRYIYRTNGNTTMAGAIADTTFYLVKDLADNTTITFNDNVADSSVLTPSWATVSAGLNVTPPTGSLLEISAARLFVAGNLTNPSYLYYSDNLSGVGNPDFFLATNFLQVRANDGDSITFLKDWLSILTVGKTNSIQKVYNSGAPSTWSITEPYSYIGCPAPYSVAITPLGIFYLARNGLYRFDGQYSYLISDAVTEDLQDIAPTNISNAVGYYWNNEYNLAYTSLVSGQQINNRVLVYDFTRDSYVIDTENVNCFTAYNSGSDSGILVSGSSSTDGYTFAHSLSSSLLTNRYLSDLTAGTFTTTYMTTSTQESPILDLEWACTLANWTTYCQSLNVSINTLADIATYLPAAIIARPTTSGSWLSPVYKIDAITLNKLYWNENLNIYGTASFQIRTGPTATPDGSWTGWSSAYTNQNGTDISGLTANTYIQVQINLSTTNINFSPYLYQASGYLFYISYSKTGSNYETLVSSIWQSGWKDFKVPGYKKLIKRIRVFYTGTSGTINVNLKNDEGDVNQNFTIDLSKTPTQSVWKNQIIQAGNYKIFTWYPPINSTTTPSPIGQHFMFTVSEGANTVWSISKIEIQFTPQELSSV